MDTDFQTLDALDTIMRRVIMAPTETWVRSTARYGAVSRRVPMLSKHSDRLANGHWMWSRFWLAIVTACDAERNRTRVSTIAEADFCIRSREAALAWARDEAWMLASL